MDTPTTGVTPHMVAVGNGKFPGTKAQDATAQAALAQIPIWRPRNGRDGTFPFWEDALNDAMAARGMSRGTINEAPPTRPPGSTQTPYTFKTPPRAVKPHGLRTGDASNIEEAPDPVTHRRTRSLRPSALTLVSCVPGSMQKASGGEHSPCGEPQASAGEARPLVSTCRCSAAPLWRAFG